MTRTKNIIVHWGGKMIAGACGVDYEGGSTRLLKFKGKVNYSQLMDKISSVMKIEFNRKVSKVVYRFPVSVSTQATANFSQLEIEDDDGVEFMFDSFDTTPGLFCIQLYVDVDSIPIDLEQHANCTEHHIQERRQNTPPVQESIPVDTPQLHPRDYTEHNAPEPRQNATPVQETVSFTPGLHPTDNMEHNTRQHRQNSPVQENVPVTARLHPRDYMQPGPLDPSVLTLQRVHRSEAVWHDMLEKPVLHCRRAGSVAHTQVLDARIVPYLEQAGFYGVARLGFIQLDWQLIAALVERWRPETHTFHLPEGECTITLQDVGILAGLPVDGHVVSGCASHDWGEVCLRLLGVAPPDDAVRGSVLQLSWLAETFEELPANANDFTIQCYARAFLLRLIGGIIFSNKSSSRVHLMFLPLFEDFKKASQYSWGAACLAWLYRELCRATNPTAKEISGPLFLLQLWALERFPHITSISRDNLSQEPLSPPGPLGCRWRNAKIVNEVSTQVLKQYRYALDRQGPDQMIWQPYTDDIIAGLPQCCTSGRAIWRAVVPLICFHIVEWHQPDRVMRQFGLQQPIPVKPHQDDALHTIDLRGNQELSWLIQHASYISLWDDRHNRVIHGEPSQDRLDYYSEYMKWYRKITRRWISPMGAAIGAVVDGIEQIYLNSGANASLDRMVDIHQTAASILGALDEERRIISVNSSSTQKAPEPVQLPGLEQGDKPTSRRRRPTMAHRRLPVEIDQSQPYTQPLLFRVTPSVASTSNAARGRKRGHTGNNLGSDGLPPEVTADAPILLE